MPPGQQELWSSLQPHGKIDVNAPVHYESQSHDKTIQLRGAARDDATSIGTSIEPVSFPIA